VKRPGSGPVLVLIPGSFVDSDDYAGIVAGLDAKLSIFIVEMRGHGESWPPPSGGTIEQFASDVLAAADDARILRFFVGGHSIGGMIAIEIGGRHPHRVRGIVSIEGWTHHTVQNAFAGQNTGTLSAAQLARKDQLRQPVMSRWTPQQVKEFGSIWRKWNGFDLLNRTPVPVLELWGDRNQPHLSREQMQIPDRPNIDLQWLAGASHYLPIERPAEVAEAINAFIRRVEKGSNSAAGK
jgi:pimeloyl-ACP methyl ester carboxylesterase